MKLTAQRVIRTDFGRLWELTQTPDQHARWDLRFSSIEYLPKRNPDEPQQFRYLTRIGFGLAIEGWGETVAGRADCPTSALRFGSNDPKSLIREGTGCWIYKPQAGQVDFSTIYDYRVRFGLAGRLVDRWCFRPLMQWATRWSFDRLRLWLERDLKPEVTLPLWLLKLAVRLGLGISLTGYALSQIGAGSDVFQVALGLIGLWLLTGQAEEVAAIAGLALLIGWVAAGATGNFSWLGLWVVGLVSVPVLARFSPKACRAAGRKDKSGRKVKKEQQQKEQNERSKLQCQQQL
jgi:hypothetical protein